jgi:hypothetical protein
MLLESTMDSVESTPPIGLEDSQPDSSLFNPVLSALLDHILFIESEIAAVRRLVEEVLP